FLNDSGISSLFIRECKRSHETVAPRGTSIGVTATVIAARNTAALVAKLHQLNGNALVVGHGDTIPNIIKALGIDSPINIPDEDYSEFLIVTVGDKPQLFRLHYPS